MIVPGALDGATGGSRRSRSARSAAHVLDDPPARRGERVTDVGKYLGHGWVTMTLNVYTRVMRGAQQELANAVAEGGSIAERR